MDLLRPLINTQGSGVKSIYGNLANIAPSTLLSQKVAVISPKPSGLPVSLPVI
jgi:hypothetical protein